MSSPLPPAVVETVKANLTGPRRAFVVIGLVVALGVLWFASQWAAGPRFVPLYQGLELGAVAPLTDALGKAGIPFQLEHGGSTVLVPPADVARARVLLAKDGLPLAGKPGLELFDKPTWGMTDFTQRITYRRALEGELARTIGTLQGVEKAQVHLALPENSTLRRLERPAQAAVVLKLRGGMPLGPEMVQGIAYIVSNAVEQLRPENVAVMDDAGRLLSVPNDAQGVFGVSSRQLELQRGVEKQLQAKVEQLLATVMGPGQARVQVAASLNFEQVERTTEQYDPEGNVLTTEQRSEGAPDPETGAGTVISNQYANSKRVERVIGSVGGVRQLTVAVLVDEAVLLRDSAASGRPPAAQVAALELAVRNAIGLDSARGDRLTITPLPFSVNTAAALAAAAGADSVAPKASPAELAERFARPGLVLLGLLLAFVLGWRALKPARALPAPRATVAAVAAAPAAAPLAPPEPEDDTALLPPLQPAQSKESLALRATVARESSEKPEVAAQVIRAWVGAN